MEVVVGLKVSRRLNLTQVHLFYLCNIPGHNTVDVHHYFSEVVCDSTIVRVHHCFSEAVCDSTIVETINLFKNFLEICLGFSVRLKIENLNKKGPKQSLEKERII